MSEAHRWESTERPAILISRAPDVDEQLLRWVMVGAEEEGVPCRVVEGSGQDAVTLAYSAAQGSHVNVGVGLAHGKIALQEAHMPATQAVMIFPLDRQAQGMARLVGCNAGRLVKRMPLRFLETQERAVVLPIQTPSSSEPNRTAPVSELRSSDPEIRSSVIPKSALAGLMLDGELDSGWLNSIIEGVLKQRGLV